MLYCVNWTETFMEMYPGSLPPVYTFKGSVWCDIAWCCHSLHTKSFKCWNFLSQIHLALYSTSFSFHSGSLVQILFWMLCHSFTYACTYEKSFVWKWLVKPASHIYACARILRIILIQQHSAQNYMARIRQYTW